MKAFLKRLAKIPEGAVLIVNGVISALVAVTHGGALLLVLRGRVPLPPGYAELTRTIVPVSLPIATLMIMGSAVGLAWRGTRWAVLPFQAVTLLLSGLVVLAWSAGVLLHGIPPGNFVWTPGILTSWVAYPCLLVGRFAVPPSWREHPACVYAPLAGAAIALPVDLGVLARFILRTLEMGWSSR